MKSFIAKSTWLLEHSDEYILSGWKVLSVVSVLDLIAAVLLIVARALVGDTSNAASKYSCSFVLRDKYLVPYENPAGSSGTCLEATIYLDRGNAASVAAIVLLFLSTILDGWTPVRREEHGFCECTKLNLMCGITWIIHMSGIFSIICSAVAYSENYRIWDAEACLDNPYVGGSLVADNPYGDGCSVALTATSLVRRAVVTSLYLYFVLASELVTMSS